MPIWRRWTSVHEVRCALLVESGGVRMFIYKPIFTVYCPAFVGGDWSGVDLHLLNCIVFGNELLQLGLYRKTKFLVVVGSKDVAEGIFHFLNYRKFVCFLHSLNQTDVGHFPLSEHDADLQRPSGAAGEEFQLSGFVQRYMI